MNSYSEDVGTEVEIFQAVSAPVEGTDLPWEKF